MTDDQKQLLAVFESKIHQLMSMYKALKEENAALKNELSEKDKMIQAAKENIDHLNLRYETLKIARVVSIRQDEITGFILLTTSDDFRCSEFPLHLGPGRIVNRLRRKGLCKTVRDQI